MDSYNGIPVREVDAIPASDVSSVWYVSLGEETVNLNPNWHQRIAMRYRGIKRRAKDALAVFRGNMEARDWDDY